MKKRLEIAVDNIDWDKNEVRFHITEQSHRNVNFGNVTKNLHTNDGFVATNGLMIVSTSWPEFKQSASFTERGVLFVNGDMSYKDNCLITSSFKDFGRVLQAIQEYNTYEFSDGKYKIVIDGKTIEISDESFKALKASLK